MDKVELLIGIAETYDVVVEPKEDRAYTVFAESMDRSGFARGTLAPRPGMSAPIPPRRKRPVLTMKDMGMDMSTGAVAGTATGAGTGTSSKAAVAVGGGVTVAVGRMGASPASS